jgi:hypothetical protein
MASGTLPRNFRASLDKGATDGSDSALGDLIAAIEALFLGGLKVRRLSAPPVDDQAGALDQTLAMAQAHFSSHEAGAWDLMVSRRFA